MNTTQKFKEYILQNPLESKKSALQTALKIERSPLKYRIPRTTGTVDMMTKTLHIPKIFSQQDKKVFEHITNVCTGIFNKTIAAYKTDPEVRKLFGFSEAIEEMILRDPGYTVSIPMLRVDIFYNEDTKDFYFCEFNTDGTSAMYENNMMKDFMQYNNAFCHFDLDLEYMELMDSWADAFEDVWQSAGHGKSRPSIVIADFLENAYIPEFYAFRDLFEKRGYPCEIEDVRNLKYKDGKLYSKQTATIYDVIYRRAVTSDLEAHMDEVQPFFEALKDSAVVCIGDIQTQIIHSKAINEALTNPVLQNYFSPYEIDFIEQHMPQTFDLTEDRIEELCAEPSKWILKPKDSYGAHGVFAGVDVSREQWRNLLEKSCHEDFIIQRYIPHFKTENIDLVNGQDFKEYSNMTGLYIYNGKFAGVYSRLSDSGIISTQYNERMVPTFFLKS